MIKGNSQLPDSLFNGEFVFKSECVHEPIICHFDVSVLQRKLEIINAYLIKINIIAVQSTILNF